MTKEERHKQLQKDWRVINANKLKKYRKEWYATPEAKKWMHDYYQNYYQEHKKTPEGLAKQKKFRQSEDGKAYYKAYNIAWRKSEKGKAWISAYMKAKNATPERKAYMREYNIKRKLQNS